MFRIYHVPVLSARPGWVGAGSLITPLQIASMLLLAILITDRPCLAQEAPGGFPQGIRQAERAIASGEFAVAKRLARTPQADPSADAVLAQVASAQSRSGDTAGAAATLRQINQSAPRQRALESAAQNAGAGGGAMADFQSLMTLIETTVVPDTWESLGGNSTMAPYPQGVFVDPEGTVRENQWADPKMANELARVGELLQIPSNAASKGWKSPAPLRCVSIRRLRDVIADKRLRNRPLGDEILHLAGLSEVRYVVFTDDDIIIAGPVGGIDTDRGWYVDRTSGRGTLRSDFLARSLVAALNHTPFGCTIDPTPQGMRSAANVAAEIQSGKLPIGLAADRLRDALGLQRIEVFGTAGDTAVALLMVEADRHMKELALGKHPMPDGVDNYLDAVDDLIDQGPPNGLLLRLWFTAKAQSVRSDDDQTVFELSGSPIQLSSENQRALADGGRGRVTVDPRSERFVAGFNRNWASICDEYPIYGALESLYRTAAVAQLITQFGQSEPHRALADSLASEDESRDWLIPAPQRVASIATLHHVRSGNQVHHILMASGGVEVSPARLVSQNITSYPALENQRNVDQNRPIRVQHWWWDENHAPF